MTRKLTEMERLDNQLILGQYRVGPEAAREIARREIRSHSPSLFSTFGASCSGAK